MMTHHLGLYEEIGFAILAKQQNHDHVLEVHQAESGQWKWSADCQWLGEHEARQMRHPAAQQGVTAVLG